MAFIPEGKAGTGFKIGMALAAIATMATGGLMAPALVLFPTIGASIGGYLAARGRRAYSPSRGRTVGAANLRNPVKGDSVVPVVYGDPGAADEPLFGPRVAPVYQQAFTTPRGVGAYAKESRARGRGSALSFLLSVCHGPVEAITDVKLNGEPLYEETEDPIELPGKAGLRYPFGKRDVVRSMVWVTVEKADGVTVEERGVLHATVDRVYRFDGRTSWFKLPALEARGEVYDDSRDIECEYAIHSGADRTKITDTTEVRPHIFTTQAGDIVVNMQFTPPFRAMLWMKVPVRRTLGFEVIPEKNRPRYSRLEFFEARDPDTGTLYSPPVKGDTIKVRYIRGVFQRAEFETRLGSLHQSVIPGFHEIRQGFARSAELTRGNPVSVTTQEPVDDVAVIVNTGQLFRQFDEEDGSSSQVHADFKIEWRAAGGGEDDWRTLQDPRGKEESKRADEFRIVADTGSLVSYHFYVGALIKETAENATTTRGRKARAQLAEFFGGGRKRFDVRLTRTSAEKGDGQQIFDSIFLEGHTEVLEVPLNYGGVALLGIHNATPQRTAGSAPQITCRTVGRTTLRRWTGTEWIEDADARGNPVWAAVDLITRKVYGGGGVFDLSSIDAASALDAANWCDEMVTQVGHAPEKRARIDYPVDNQETLMGHVATMLEPARVLPVMQGNLWRFVVDRAVPDLAAVPHVIEGGRTGAVVAGSANMTHASVAQDITEILANFNDRELDYEQGEVFRSPETPGATRRRREIAVVSASRRTEVTRHVEHIFAQVTHKPRIGDIGFSFSTLEGLRFQSGDVIRFTSTRLAIDAYFRILSLNFSQPSYSVAATAREYVPALYGQKPEHKRVLYTPPAGDPKTQPFTPKGLTKDERTTRVGGASSPVRPRIKNARIRRVS